MPRALVPSRPRFSSASEHGGGVHLPENCRDRVATLQGRNAGSCVVPSTSFPRLLPPPCPPPPAAPEPSAFLVSHTTPAAAFFSDDSTPPEHHVLCTRRQQRARPGVRGRRECPETPRPHAPHLPLLRPYFLFAKRKRREGRVQLRVRLRSLAPGGPTNTFMFLFFYSFASFVPLFRQTVHSRNSHDTQHSRTQTKTTSSSSLVSTTTTTPTYRRQLPSTTNLSQRRTSSRLFFCGAHLLLRGLDQRHSP